MSVKLKLVIDNGFFLAFPALGLANTWEMWQLWPLSNSVTSFQGRLGLQDFLFLFFIGPRPVGAHAGPFGLYKFLKNYYYYFVHSFVVAWKLLKLCTHTSGSSGPDRHSHGRFVGALLHMFYRIILRCSVSYRIVCFDICMHGGFWSNLSFMFGEWGWTQCTKVIVPLTGSIK